MHHVHRSKTPVFASLVESLHDDLVDRADALSGASVASVIAAIWASTYDPAAFSSNCGQNSPYIDDQQPPSDTPGDALAIDEEAIRHDIGLAPGLTAEQVSELRRKFARRNHPDLFPPQHRDYATLRMTIANALCDAYRG